MKNPANFVIGARKNDFPTVKKMVNHLFINILNDLQTIYCLHQTLKRFLKIFNNEHFSPGLFSFHSACERTNKSRLVMPL